MTVDPYRYFRLEARELVDRLHAGVLAIERELGGAAGAGGGGGADIVKTLLRAAHTLKGAARAVRLPEMAEHAHAIEGALEPFRDAGGVTRAAIEAILPRLGDMEQRVRALGRAPDPEAATAAPTVATPPTGSPAATAGPAVGIDDAARALRAEIGDMDSVLDGITEAHAAAGTVRRLAGEIEAAHRLAELVVDQLAPGGGGSPSGQLRGTAAQLAAALGALDRSAGAAVEKLDRELRGVHAAAEQLRLVPASALFTALERSARDAARALGKEVAFEHRGGEVRLDAHVLTGVQPALLQLVRNAIAHGIEPPAGRERAGKPRAGRIAIEVERRARRVVFRCRDDGRGLDVEVLREVAVRRGLVSSSARALTAGDLVQLLLRGGISTAAVVTELSGRGIGLDVVRDAATRLGGAVSATSE
ncbi:MAG TPA: ATP-binding protein, partial [Kofleriaceae bacterium]|nr:ATP-binding protein [Kofleriaceae bacterium]